MKVNFKTVEEIKENINNDYEIVGVAELSFIDLIWNDYGIEFVNNVAADQIVGKKYGRLLEDIRYEIVGCDIKNQTIFIKVIACAGTLLDEIEKSDDDLEL